MGREVKERGRRENYGKKSNKDWYKEGNAERATEYKKKVDSKIVGRRSKRIFFIPIFLYRNEPPCLSSENFRGVQ